MSFFRKTVKEEIWATLLDKRKVYGDQGLSSFKKHEKDDKSTIKIVFIFQIFWIHMIVLCYEQTKI